MGNIGTPEILIVLIIALLVLGPQRLPQAARQFGKAMGEFRRVTGGLQAEMRDAMSSMETEIKSAVDRDDEPPVLPPAQPPYTPAATPYIFEPPAALLAADAEALGGTDTTPLPEAATVDPPEFGIFAASEEAPVSPPSEPTEPSGAATSSPEGDAPPQG